MSLSAVKVSEGVLGPERKKLTYSFHAERRMWQRDITEAEVREVLSQPKEQHFFNPDHGTMYAQHKFPNMGRSLIVAYDEREEEVRIVTVIDEDEG
jgi:Domain of unknown function (DUF4258)